MKSILDLEHTDARQFFLKGESYEKIELPPYFVFDNLLQAVSDYVGNQDLQTLYKNNQSNNRRYLPSEFEDVNYKLLNNKDGKFAWRPLQLIHPALYVSLVNRITDQNNWRIIVDRFKVFQENPNIKCYSIPLISEDDQSDKATLVSQWWQKIEQQSLELALKYDYVLHTDISDCYSSIYTHSIPWAIHTKSLAKQQRRDSRLIGNVIDRHLQDMSYGQTNGIPQGSVLMDFIAELILGYIDSELSNKIQEKKLKDYEIIRYRDDYRIFSNSPRTIEHITKLLTEILIEHGMRLNTEKTIISNNVITDSIKPDKLYWIYLKKRTKSIQEHLLLIHKLSEEFPNSGSLSKALSNFFYKIKDIDKTKLNITVLISILVDIMYKNPRIYPIASAILSKLLSLIKDINDRNEILNNICKKFEKIPNTGHLQIWLQRITLKNDRQRIYEYGIQTG